MNRYWKQQQAKIRREQSSDTKPSTDVPATDKPVLLLQQGPPECEGCPVRPQCKQIMRMWHARAPRPELARAWCSLIDRHAVQMICLSGLRTDATISTKFSLRSEK